MARGNDADSALVDLRGEYGASSGNAQTLIDTARSAWTPQLRAAVLTPRDVDDENDLVKVDLDKVQAKVGDAGEVISAAKRGAYVVAVIEVPSGRVYKDVLEAKDVGFSEKAPRQVAETDDEKAAREVHSEHMRSVAETSKAAREAEKAAEEARAKALEAAQKRAEKTEKSE